jgi:hypothetical protein
LSAVDVADQNICVIFEFLAELIPRRRHVLAVTTPRIHVDKTRETHTSAERDGNGKIDVRPSRLETLQDSGPPVESPRACCIAFGECFLSKVMSHLYMTTLPESPCRE